MPKLAYDANSYPSTTDFNDMYALALSLVSLFSDPPRRGFDIGAVEGEGGHTLAEINRQRGLPALSNGRRTRRAASNPRSGAPRTASVPHPPHTHTTPMNDLTDSRCTYQLSYRSDQYDPYIPGSNPNQPGGGPGPAASTGGSGASGSKTQAIQQEIDATVGIMKDNITKVAERGERLDALQDKTGSSSSSLLDVSFSTPLLTHPDSARRQPRSKRARVPQGREPRSQEDGELTGWATRAWTKTDHSYSFPLVKWWYVVDSCASPILVTVFQPKLSHSAGKT